MTINKQANKDEQEIQLKKLKLEIAKGMESFKQEKVYDIGEVRAMFDNLEK